MSADETFELDETDRGILFLRQDDARHNTTEEIAEAVGVSSSTVSNRIQAMEEGGVIDGYGPYVSYDRADIPLHMLLSVLSRPKTVFPLLRRQSVSTGL